MSGPEESSFFRLTSSLTGYKVIHNGPNLLCRLRPVLNTNYKGLAYMGEYPLTWSAFLCNEGIYNLLLDKGADPDAQDTYGECILFSIMSSEFYHW